MFQNFPNFQNFQISKFLNFKTSKSILKSAVLAASLMPFIEYFFLEITFMSTFLSRYNCLSAITNNVISGFAFMSTFIEYAMWLWYVVLWF